MAWSLIFIFLLVCAIALRGIATREARDSPLVLKVCGPIDHELSLSLCDVLSGANAHSNFTLVIDSRGGQDDAAHRVARCILAYNGVITAYIPYKAGSAAAFLALCCLHNPNSRLFMGMCAYITKCDTILNGLGFQHWYQMQGPLSNCVRRSQWLTYRTLLVALKSRMGPARAARIAFDLTYSSARTHTCPIWRADALRLGLPIERAPFPLKYYFM